MNVYFFIQRDGLLKIGKANNVEKRFWQLGGMERFADDGHYVVSVTDVRQAFLLERCLHLIFSAWRVRATHQPGHTELFAAQVLPKALHLLCHNPDAARSLTAEEWVSEGGALDRIGSKTGIWFRGRHHAKPCCAWSPSRRIS